MERFTAEISGGLVADSVLIVSTFNLLSNHLTSTYALSVIENSLSEIFGIS